ncbi:MAG: GNAT family N-acetyltransferase [Firmicutes bacterium]|nr:GNAT family N-acetyltransferase [Bacillota bacterium]
MGQGRAEGEAAEGGARVRLRPLSAAEHRAAWRRWLRDPEVAEWMGGRVPHAPVTLGIERASDGALIGGAALVDVSEDGRAELVIAIGQADARGRGYGREAVRQAVAYARASLGVQEVYLRVRADNRRAIRCYLASGFVREGRMVRRTPGKAARAVFLMTHRTG